MGKVLRLFQDKDLQDWEDRGEPYGPSVIDSIKNPDGDFSKKDPTSIPSPFARIDLIRSAFKYVADDKNLNGQTIYHKLVSDCLDVAEMFFNLDKYGDSVRIEVWDRKVDLDILLNSSNHRHRLYGETLQLFLNQDAEANNFDDLQKMYFLFYDSKIIGGTSPTSLFFTSANDKSFIDFGEGNDIFFDEDLQPLYKRDTEFQIYLYSLFRAYPNLSKKMANFYSYLELSIKNLDTHDKSTFSIISKLDTITPDKLITDLNNNYDTLDTGIENNNIEVLGIPLKKRKIANVKKSIVESSELIISSNKGKLKPLVLQNNLNQPLVYTFPNVLWNSSWEVPHFDSRPMDERTLPNQKDKYPYITVSDFLQPYIISLPFPLNSGDYFNGNTIYESGDPSKSYLLPLTKTFFEYFDTEDLQKHLPNGMPMIEMRVFNNSVDVILRIPIRGNARINHITLTRTYQNKGIANAVPDETMNQGNIIANTVSLAIYPFVKFTNEDKPFYRLMFLDNDDALDTKHYTYALEFYKNSLMEPIENEKTSRSLKIQDGIQTDYYSLEQDFDYIKLNHNTATGIIVPKLKQVNGTTKIKFAVDFGTTNTHVEYKIDGENGSYPFEIKKEEIQYSTLHSNSSEINDNVGKYADIIEMNSFIRHEFFPEIIGGESEFKFPIRTVTGEDIKLEFSSIPEALGDINIPFDYEKYGSKRNTHISTNLKWSDFQDSNSKDKIRVEKFIEKLLLLIRGKVLNMNGNLSKTEIIWFYPSSMDDTKVKKLEAIWNTYFKKYFDSSHTLRLSESIAPFYFYKSNRNISASDKPVVSIDIGGGTSDLVIFKGKSPILLSSMKYAANSIFGDGYGGSPEVNGFIIKYKDKVRDLLEKNSLTELLSAYNQISSRKKSEDLIAFYFSLANNKDIKDKRVPIEFSRFLSDDSDLKIVFLLFYASIIYHIAKLMKARDLGVPKNIIFSGTGAKVILIANGGTNLENLNKFTKLVFSKIFNHEISHDIEIKMEADPKEVTCKGGLEINSEIESSINIDNIKEVLIGDIDNTLVSNKPITYKNLDDALLKEIYKESISFIDFIFSLNNEMNFKNYFDVNPKHLEEYKTMLEANVMEDLKSGRDEKIERLNGNNSIPLEESLFFYPLIGALNNLAYKIAISN